MQKSLGRGQATSRTALCGGKCWNQHAAGSESERGREESIFAWQNDEFAQICAMQQANLTPPDADRQGGRDKALFRNVTG